LKLLTSTFLAFWSFSAAGAPQVWLGASGGYTHIVPDGSGQTSKNGYHLFLDATAESTHQQWTFGLGGGFFYNRVYSDGERDFPTEDPEVVREQRNLRIETRAGSAHFVARYQLWDGHLEAGLLLRSLFGSSLSFSQDKDSRQSKFFIGPQIVLKTDARSAWMQRADISLTSDLNVPQRRVYLLAAGFALGRTWPDTIIAETPKAAERFEEVLADKVINFPSGSSQLQEPASTFLKELGQFLKKHPEHWQSMTVEGHTDKKGKFDYNMKLSQDRADAVRRVILDQGNAKDRVNAQGFGPTRPLKDGETPEILALNRRVVMVFTISSREGRNQVSSEIKRLRQKYFGD
jgi:outer membrane protein OmpA-like peptidoglycan-associated protein